MLVKMDQMDVRVFVMERGFYARQTIVSYLGWDRRTRVVDCADSPYGLLRALHQSQQLPPHVVLFDVSCAEGEPDRLTGWLWALRPCVRQSRVLCLSERPDRLRLDPDVRRDRSALRSGFAYSFQYAGR